MQTANHEIVLDADRRTALGMALLLLVLVVQVGVGVYRIIRGFPPAKPLSWWDLAFFAYAAIMSFYLSWKSSERAVRFAFALGGIGLVLSILDHFVGPSWSLFASGELCYLSAFALGAVAIATCFRKTRVKNV